MTTLLELIIVHSWKILPRPAIKRHFAARERGHNAIPIGNNYYIFRFHNVKSLHVKQIKLNTLDILFTAKTSFSKLFQQNVSF